MITHSFTIKNKQGEYNAYSDGYRTLVVFKRLNPTALLAKIKPYELPKEAYNKISKRQKSYIDEFAFYKRADGMIEAWYAGSCLAVWDGKSWA